MSSVDPLEYDEYIRSLTILTGLLETIEYTRLCPQTSPEERKELEEYSVTLYQKERKVLESMINRFIQDHRPSGIELKTLSDNLRDLYKNIGKTPNKIRGMNRIFLRIIDIAERAGCLTPRNQDEDPDLTLLN